MKRFALIAGINRAPRDNPGWGAINDGIRHLLTAAYGECEFVWISLVSYSELQWETFAAGQMDGIVVCGNPRFNCTEGQQYCDAGFWEDLERFVARHRVPVADLGLGSAGSWGLDVNRLVSRINHLRKTKWILDKYSKLVSLAIARDAAAHAVVSQACPHSRLLRCTSWWAKDWHGVKPQAKDRNCVILSRNFGDGVVPAVRHHVQALSQELDTSLVAVNAQDHAWARRALRDRECHLVWEFAELLNLYARCHKIVSLRVHSSIPALSLGASVAHVYYDMRYLTLDALGVKCTSPAGFQSKSPLLFGSAHLSSLDAGKDKEHYVRALHDWVKP